MVKSDEMKPHTLTFAGVILCTCFSPLPLLQGSDPQKIVLVVDIPRPTVLPLEQDIVFNEDDEILFSVRPVSWFLRNNIPLCFVSLAPYEHERVYKPPWARSF